MEHNKHSMQTTHPPIDLHSSISPTFRFLH